MAAKQKVASLAELLTFLIQRGVVSGRKKIELVELCELAKEVSLVFDPDRADGLFEDREEVSHDLETSSSSEDEDLAADTTLAKRGQSTAAKFVLRRARKGLNTLSKEVVKGRKMIRNVRLGHGLFDLIRQERMTKKTAAMMEKQKKLEAARNMWQPPKRDSESEEESDDDMIQDDDSDLAWLDDLPDSRPSTRSGRHDSIFDTEVKDQGSGYSSGEAYRQKSAAKKKPQVARPYTPQHNSLSEVTDDPDDKSHGTLFRQLCVLNWILDAMNLEQGLTMSPIMTCWSHNEIGGLKITVRRAQQEKQAESRWRNFLSSPVPGKVSKKSVSSGRLGRHTRQSVRLFNPRTSIQSPSPSPSSSSSVLNIPPTTTTTTTTAASTVGAATSGQHREDTIPEEEASAVKPAPPSLAPPAPEHVDDEEVDAAYSKSMFKFLDEYYDSLRKEKSNEEPDGESPAAGQAKEKSHDPEKKKKSRKKSKEREKTPDRLALHDMQEALGVPRGMRADKFVKPKPSAELLEFHEKKASNKYLTLSSDLASKFKEVQDDKAMTLHDILEQMERERLSKCQSKYMTMQTGTSSVHRALDAMRREGERMLQKPADDAMRRKSSFRGNWYTDLHENIPLDLKALWYYQCILNKLRKYGMVESTSKQSVYKFLKVLEGLRDWEVCSPDISAAIEFCRERIVDLSVEEYEEWFKSVFPRITRPHTAPPGLRGGGKKEVAAPTSVSTTFLTERPAVRQVQSAFVRRAQR